MELTKEAVREFHHGHKTVGMTRVQLTTLPFSINKGVLIRTPGSVDPTPNTACIWVGGAGVTADSGASGGMPVPPGEAMFIPIDDPSLLWLVSDAADQDAAWMAM